MPQNKLYLTRGFDGGMDEPGGEEVEGVYLTLDSAKVKFSRDELIRVSDRLRDTIEFHDVTHSLYAVGDKPETEDDDYDLSWVIDKRVTNFKAKAGDVVYLVRTSDGHMSEPGRQEIAGPFKTLEDAKKNVDNGDVCVSVFDENGKKKNDVLDLISFFDSAHAVYVYVEDISDYQRATAIIDKYTVK